VARGDWFIDLFTSEAEKLIDILSARSREPPSVPLHWWVPGLPEPPEEPPVAAVDGGGGIVDLGGRNAVYIARAFGYIEDGEPERLLELRYIPARDSRILDALRTWVEHRAATRLALRLPPGSLLLMDGSYWVTLTAGLGALVRLARGRVSSVSTVYTGVISGHAAAEAAKLVEVAAQRGVAVAYVSKDHGLRALKEKVLLDTLAQRSPSLQPLAERALRWYPLHGRASLLEARSLLPQELRPLLDAAVDPAYRDPAFIDDTAGRAQGYTWLLRLPPPRQIAKAAAEQGWRGLLEAASERARRLLGPDSPGVEEAEALPEKARQLDRLPAARMLYLRPSPSDQPLLVEQPDPRGSYLAPGRVLEEPGEQQAWLAASLALHYQGPEYYNIPLIAAHMNATLDAGQLASYTRLLEALAAARGARLAASRRAAIATRLPTRRRRRRRGSP